MNFYYDQNKNELYLTSNRNGSTILLEIAGVCENLTSISLSKALEYLKSDPDAPIHCAFRDPYVRFASGLEVQFFNVTGIVMPPPPKNYSEIAYLKTIIGQYKTMLRYVVTNSQTTSSFYHYLRLPYHLYDTHLDHWLWPSVFFGAYGYNVKLVPMYDFSKLLLENFPKAKSLIKKRERLTSFDTVKQSCIPLMDAFREIMIDNFEWSAGHENGNPDMLITWDKWMNVEQEIFLTYKSNHHLFKPIKMYNKLLDKMINDPFYISDIESPKCAAMNLLVDSIHDFKPHNFRLKKMTDSFRNAKAGWSSFIRKEHY
jgi:hypothetical protein